MFPEYINKLHELNTWIWLLSIIAPTAMYFLKAGSQSYFIGAGVWIVSQFINLRIEPYLSQFVDESRDHLVYWYGTWAAINALCIFAIYLAHLRRNVAVGFTSISIMFAYAGLFLLQLIRHLELEITGTNYFSKTYTIGINTGNVVITLLISAPLLVYIWKYKLRQRNQNV
ncbi:hypothetical protein N473_07015 [Pseudoalteromonas luteoviolacea CPMOR-1]|uniref:Uncharacterized protein n=1 Tax=Pseudoalteromonas luteoviolacea CPMOR-1 TaxID=1365248 RepID=A0A162AS46_9GAMM|nr:hypothetical protein [Pseudoalteromonas luteoviolacea]KZN57619.1 hypothetical protein N473_07015 [Pseudoalteromonas luteoviolacea CPMOR-1]